MNALLLAVFLFTPVVFGNNGVISSTDELQLTYVHRNAAPLYGNPGETHRLELIFKNLGSTRGTFNVTQTSTHESFVGQYPKSFSLDKNQYKTIVVSNLIVPTTVKAGNTVEVTVSVTRVDGSVTSQMYEVHQTMLFLIGPQRSDPSGPKTSVQDGGSCPVARNNTAQCDQYKWHVEMNVKDKESGVRSLEVSTAGKDSIRSPVQFSYRNFPIGTTDSVDVNADISCCVEGVRLTVTNGVGIESDDTYSEDSFNRNSAARFLTALSSLAFWAIVAAMLS